MAKKIMKRRDVLYDREVGYHENSLKLREHRPNIRDVPASEDVPQSGILHARQLTQSAETHMWGEPLMLKRGHALTQSI